MPLDLRSQLVYALRDDLIGPDADDPRDAAHQAESLSSAPSRWYLTGFLAPTAQPVEEKQDDTAEEGMDAAVDGPEEGEADPQAVSRRPVFPSSLGLSVLVGPATTTLAIRVTYGTYAPGPCAPPAVPAPAKRGGHSEPPPPEEECAPRVTWTRTPHEHRTEVTLDGAPKQEIALAGADGVVLRVIVRPPPAAELPLVPRGTRHVTLFLVNQRRPFSKPDHDRGYLFQARFGVTCGEGFLARPGVRGAAKEDDLDARVGDLQHRDACAFAVGHGVSTLSTLTTSTVAQIDPAGAAAARVCHEVATCWVPTAAVAPAVPAPVAGVELRMEALAALGDGSDVRPALAALVTGYRAWLDDEAAQATALDTDVRKDTAAALLDAGRRACDRIEAGIRLLEGDPLALDAFRAANKAMAMASRRRRRALLDVRAAVPAWRPFQLAFLLMSLAAQVDPAHPDREVVDLVFFPPGAGRTEAYLGLAAFTLVLRRLRRPGSGSAGVGVVLRFALRPLASGPIERAAALICALEIQRRAAPAKYGPQRFSIGLQVGRPSTPNRFGTEKDRDDSTARNRVLAFTEDPSANPSPIPLDACPWCGEPFGNDTFRLMPDSRIPVQLRVRCASATCDFRSTQELPEGLPVVCVDDEIYRELPCFLLATVDRFAELPWAGKTGLLLGRNVTHQNGYGFFGPGPRPSDARALPAPLLPPDLILQDDLHHLTGPLGTVVALYETAIDHLTTRVVGGAAIRPKIVAATATVERAQAQIQALFGRSRVEVFPPPGQDLRRAFFLETAPDTDASARLHVGLAAPGRSQRALLMRAYVVLLAASQRAFEADPAAADPYMTLVGYFSSLRELGGSRRIVDDEIRARLLRVRMRHRVGESPTYLAERAIEPGCVELTSRRSADEVRAALGRLEERFVDGGGRRQRAPVDVVLTSAMITAGMTMDVERLGLMVVCGQPVTSGEYIRATGRIGRGAPGVVVSLLNAHKPGDRARYEGFTAAHGTFFRRGGEGRVTPFSPRAVDRGLAGVAVALARLGDGRLTPPDAAAAIAAVRGDLGFLGEVVASRAAARCGDAQGHGDDGAIDEVRAMLRARVESLLDSWACVARDDPSKDGLTYQRFEDGQASKRHLLRTPLDPELSTADPHERRFVAGRSMRDGEGAVDVYVMRLKESAVVLADERAGERQ